MNLFKFVLFSHLFLFFVTFNISNAYVAEEMSSHSSAEKQDFAVDFLAPQIIPGTQKTYQIDFSVLNSTDSEKELFYSITLLDKNGVPRGEYSYPEPLVIPGLQRLYKTVKYNIPDHTPDGLYTFSVSVLEKRGVYKTTDVYTSEQIKIGGDSVDVNVGFCYLAAGDGLVQYFPRENVVVDENESLKIFCNLSGVEAGKNLVLTPVIKNSLTGEDPVAIDSYELGVIDVKGESEYSFDIKKPSVPGSYVATLYFKDKSGIAVSRFSDFYYTIKPASHNFGTIYLDKDSYDVGDVARVSFSLKSMSDVDYSLSLFVTDGRVICSDKVPILSTGSNGFLQSVDVPINKKCNNAMLSVESNRPFVNNVNVDDKIKKETAVTMLVKKTDYNFAPIMLIISLIFIFLITFLVFFKKKSSRVSSIFMLAIFSSFIFGAGSVFAGSSGSYGDFVVELDKEAYFPSSNINIDVTVGPGVMSVLGDRSRVTKYTVYGGVYNESGTRVGEVRTVFDFKDYASETVSVSTAMSAFGFSVVDNSLPPNEYTYKKTFTVKGPSTKGDYTLKIFTSPDGDKYKIEVPFKVSGVKNLTVKRPYQNSGRVWTDDNKIDCDFSDPEVTECRTTYLVGSSVNLLGALDNGYLMYTSPDFSTGEYDDCTEGTDDVCNFSMKDKDMTVTISSVCNGSEGFVNDEEGNCYVFPKLLGVTLKEEGCDPADDISCNFDGDHYGSVKVTFSERTTTGETIICDNTRNIDCSGFFTAGSRIVLSGPENFLNGIFYFSSLGCSGGTDNQNCIINSLDSDTRVFAYVKCNDGYELVGGRCLDKFRTVQQTIKVLGGSGATIDSDNEYFGSCVNSCEKIVQSQMGTGATMRLTASIDGGTAVFDFGCMENGLNYCDVELTGGNRNIGITTECGDGYESQETSFTDPDSGQVSTGSECVSGTLSTGGSNNNLAVSCAEGFVPYEDNNGQYCIQECPTDYSVASGACIRNGNLIWASAVGQQNFASAAPGTVLNPVEGNVSEPEDVPESELYKYIPYTTQGDQANGGVGGAQGGGGGDGLQVTLESSVAFLNDVIIPFLLAVGFLFFLINVFRYFILQGTDAEGRERAKKHAVYSVMAFVFIIIFWGIVNVIVDSIGLDVDNQPQSDYVLQKNK